ncbi:hypothetical protein N8D74_17810 (plasmid) [Curtobacterium flaccumfaciens]|uniref:Uncharacterized protein n=1 Tax=Curtobacterium poinsettiae TaxID=159612 RepID=A0A9Q9T5C8_9MICO|nr:hypothetical protein [Curtobacterium flaccumfaciens]MBT1620582.1 hypothetical protein [Curtobacterium flaccumfaciens pv. poinsettiae]MCU0154550.1 hypothetical protein [Curtobacterium flaccumfaciens pv. poinsettiae]UXN16913.1 hypothetical protein N8D76_17615 [Curtobacterium flaccumfaciens pv. poinsettiae]UXN27138.1 hypothetical protein N8D74_17810 [Curtobacterium flaccumfaciens]UYC82729.1 hypothetical protein OE229_18025 [Curtobacterium flaccumfaciens pv. poinsettiae]
MMLKISRERGLVHDWLWDTQMRQLSRGLVGLLIVGWTAIAVGAVLLAVQLVGGAA